MTFLIASFHAVRKAAPTLDRSQRVKLFGKDVTVDGVLQRILVHNHEHMGQLIAYARVNGVVPPWSAKSGSQSRSGPNRRAVRRRSHREVPNDELGPDRVDTIRLNIGPDRPRHKSVCGTPGTRVRRDRGIRERTRASFGRIPAPDPSNPIQAPSRICPVHGSCIA